MTIKEAITKLDTLINDPEPSLFTSAQACTLVRQIVILLEKGYTLDSNFEQAKKEAKL